MKYTFPYGVSITTIQFAKSGTSVTTYSNQYSVCSVLVDGEEWLNGAQLVRHVKKEYGLFLDSHISTSNFALAVEGENAAKKFIICGNSAREYRADDGRRGQWYFNTSHVDLFVNFIKGNDSYPRVAEITRASMRNTCAGIAASARKNAHIVPEINIPTAPTVPTVPASTALSVLEQELERRAIERIIPVLSRFMEEKLNEMSARLEERVRSAASDAAFANDLVRSELAGELTSLRQELLSLCSARQNALAVQQSAFQRLTAKVCSWLTVLRRRLTVINDIY